MLVEDAAHAVALARGQLQRRHRRATEKARRPDDQCEDARDDRPQRPAVDEGQDDQRHQHAAGDDERHADGGRVAARRAAREASKSKSKSEWESGFEFEFERESGRSRRSAPSAGPRSSRVIAPHRAPAEPNSPKRPKSSKRMCRRGAVCRSSTTLLSPSVRASVHADHAGRVRFRVSHNPPSTPAPSPVSGCPTSHRRGPATLPPVAAQCRRAAPFRLCWDC